MTDEIRDADGCEDFESLEESGLHDDPADTPGETAETEVLTDEEAAQLEHSME